MHSILYMSALIVDITFCIPLFFQGDHMARAIGRICGAKGRIRMCVENATRTRIIVADETIHILGSNERIAVARRALCDLILGSPPNKIFGKIRTHAARLDAVL